MRSQSNLLFSAIIVFVQFIPIEEWVQFCHNAIGDLPTARVVQVRPVKCFEYKILMALQANYSYRVTPSSLSSLLSSSVQLSNVRVALISELDLNSPDVVT